MSNRAVAYVRVSTKKQKEVSPEVQREKLREYAAAKGLEIVEEFEETRSGFAQKARVEFYRMLEYVAEHRISHVLYYLTNRVSRNLEDWQELKRANVRVHNVMKARSANLNDRDDWQAICDEERDLVEGKRFSYETGFRVRESQLRNATKGLFPGPPPLGYLVNKKRLIDPAEPRYTIDPVRGPLFQTMFRLWASGTETRRSLTTKMRDMGLRSLKGHPLHRSQVESYLKNPFYTGRFRWDGVEYDNHGQWEPLISRALFDECAEAFNAKRTVQRRGPDYPLRGLLTCGLCGCAFIREAPTKRRSDGSKKTYGYYRCTFQRAKCYEAGSPRFTEAEMDAMIEAAVGMLRLDPLTYDWLKAEVEETARLRRETAAVQKARLAADLAQVEERRSKTWAVYLDGSFADPAFLKEEFNRLSDQRAALAARLAALETQETSAATAALDALLICKDFRNQYLSANPEKRRRLNRLLIITIRVHPLKVEKRALFADLQRAIAMDEFPLEIEWNEPFNEMWEMAVGQKLDELSHEHWEANKSDWELRKKDDFVRMAPRAGLEPAT
jgi:site-specific DNA recombinase